METPIKHPPELHGREAKTFNERAKACFDNKGIVNFSDKVKELNVILKKAKLC